MNKNNSTYEFNGKITDLEALVKQNANTNFDNVHHVPPTEELTLLTIQREKFWKGGKSLGTKQEFVYNEKTYRLVEHIALFDQSGGKWFDIIAGKQKIMPLNIDSKSALTYFVVSYTEVKNEH